MHARTLTGWGLVTVLLMFTGGCSDAPTAPDSGLSDAGPTDSGRLDSGQRTDGAVPEVDGGRDSGAVDSGPVTDGGAADPDAGWLPLQLNDVTVLLPLTTQATELATGYLQASSVGRGGPLLPADLYAALGPISGTSGNPPPGGIGTARYEDLRVVAVRLDPCFASLAPDPHDPTCRNQVRLVLQEVLDRGGVNAADSALHAFYELSRAEVLELAQGLARLRAGRGALGPLQPHPVIVAEGLGGPANQALQQWVLRYAGRGTLRRVAKLSTTTPGFGWSFSNHDVDVSGPTITNLPIATVAAMSQNFFRGFATTVDGQPVPVTTSSDNFKVLMNELGSATTEQRTTAFDGLVRIENPTRHSANTIDCVSCHTATPIALLVAKPKFGLEELSNANVYAPATSAVPLADRTATFDNSAGFNLHALSYVGRAPGINQRTVNETIAVVDWLNAHHD